MENQNLSENLLPNIYERLGEMTPFVFLVNSQFSNFVGALPDDETLNNTEREGIDKLWTVACRDIDGNGNNIWNLKEGSFLIYNSGDIKIFFEKKISDLITERRMNFVYYSSEGNFVISQNNKNEEAFMVYVSKNISKRLLVALSKAEAKALGLKQEEIGNVLLNGFGSFVGQIR